MENFITQPERTAPLLTDRLTSLAEAARSLEGSLYKERAYAKELGDYVSRQNLHIQQIGDGQKALRSQLSELQTLEAAASHEIQKLSAELSQAMKELAQYRNAWSQVLRREEEARTILIGETEKKARADALEGRIGELNERILLERDQAERARRAQTEAETQIVKLNEKAALGEATHERLQKRIATLEEMKRNYTLEVSAAEARLREQYELEAIQLRQRLMGENALELARQREKVKDSVEETLTQEFAKRLQSERQRLEGEFQTRVEAETEKARGEIRTEIRNELAVKDLRIAEAEQALGRAQAQLITTHAILSEMLSETEVESKRAMNGETEIRRLHEELRKGSLRQLELGSEREKLKRQISQLAAEHGLQQKILLSTVPEEIRTIVPTTAGESTGIVTHTAIADASIPHAPGSFLNS